MTQVEVVIHHRTPALTLQEAELALECGADGVFLISHEGDDEALPALAGTLACKWQVARTASGARPLVGFNLLTVDPLVALERAASEGVHALWVGPSGISSRGVTPAARQLAAAARGHGEIEVFAGVAFKYQAEEADPPAAAHAALELGLLPTTSGAGTGSAPALAKIEAMSRATGGRLAIASGMTPENVAAFAPLVAHILVSTGVSLDGISLDPTRMRELMSAVHASGKDRPQACHSLLASGSLCLEPGRCL